MNGGCQRWRRKATDSRKAVKRKCRHARRPCRRQLHRDARQNHVENISSRQSAQLTYTSRPRFRRALRLRQTVESRNDYTFAADLILTFKLLARVRANADASRTLSAFHSRRIATVSSSVMS